MVQTERVMGIWLDRGRGMREGVGGSMSPLFSLHMETGNISLCDHCLLLLLTKRFCLLPVFVYWPFSPGASLTPSPFLVAGSVWQSVHWCSDLL